MGLIKYKLGNLIRLSEETNNDGKYTVDDVKGISIKKKFVTIQNPLFEYEVGAS
jgi:type I restriction enzyme S subunit